MPHLLANGLRTHYRRTAAVAASPGQAPIVVFVHGLGTDSLASFYLTLASPLTAAGIEAISYDLRGHGRTDRPASGYTLEHFVADLDHLLDELAVPGPVHLIGNSFGGTVAFAYAHRHPERVAGLVSIESEPPTPAWAARMASLLDGLMEALTQESTFDWIAASRGSHQARLFRLARERLQATDMVRQIPTGPMLSPADLRALTCPVLSIIGENGFHAADPYELRELLPDCTTVVIPEQDHSVLVEAHRRIRELLIDWVHGRGDGRPITASAGIVDATR